MTMRESNIEKLASSRFDVLILGGGINGAVCASALTTMGARVALIDRGDFAGATSQESSNLVWGGIKYLEGVELGLVRELCVSRNKLIRTYPSTVKEVRFFTTLAAGFRWGRLGLYLGTLLYWLLGSFSTRGPRLLSRAQIRAEEPAIDLEGMVGGFEYSDAYLIDNDARFVFNFVRAAIDHGGIVANYVESTGATRSEDGLWRTRARNLETGREFEICSKVVLNACGPFVDAHNAITGQQRNHRHVFSKGVHLLVDRITPITRVLTFFADDGRLFFILPMGPKSCIGTTDTRVEELPAEVTAEDRRFILDNVNKRLALEVPLTEADIIAERCGVRPLVIDVHGRDRDEGDWTSLSRKHAIEVNREEGHISIFGGKLTDCLNVGEEVAELVSELGVALPYRGMRWYGEPPDEVRDEYFHQAILMGLDAMTAPESSELLSTRLWRRYGASALRLLEDIRVEPAMAEVLIKGTEYIRAEIHHAARREMIVKLEDFLRRRSKIALIERTEMIRNAPGLIEACRILFGSAAEDRIQEYFERR
ncbi:MAG: glycerol-3-phosphate dehydrogenase/oxidase [bacterium]|nr:glycerol-3-phosphate dehydrogenase/oxidase [bacterium]